MTEESAPLSEPMRRLIRFLARLAVNDMLAERQAAAAQTVETPPADAPP